MKRKAIKAFLKTDAVLAGAVTGGMMLFCGLLGVQATNDLGGWLMAALLSVVASTLVIHIRRECFTDLAQRIEANAPTKWEVELNGVPIGKISDAEYAGIRLRAYSDMRNYVAQALNVGKVLLRVFDFVYLAIPIGVFWLFIGLAVFWPETFSHVLAVIQQDGPTAIAMAAKSALNLFGLVMVLCFSVHFALGLSRFGFVNRFSEAIAAAVRQHCGIASEGTLTVNPPVSFQGAST